MDKYKAEIDRWFEADKEIRKKQRHTAKRVYGRLKEKVLLHFKTVNVLIILSSQKK